MTLGLNLGPVRLELYIERGQARGWTDGRDDPPRAVAGCGIDFPHVVAAIEYPYDWHDRLRATRAALRRTLRP